MIVVNTNVIAYLLLPGEWTQSAEALLEHESIWVAPPLWRSEAANTATFIDTAIDAAVNLDQSDCKTNINTLVADMGCHSTKRQLVCRNSHYKSIVDYSQESLTATLNPTRSRAALLSPQTPQTFGRVEFAQTEQRCSHCQRVHSP